jgi:hypothetical protein
MADTKKAFWELKNTGFVEGDARDELLHREARESERGAELTETQYLGFNVPEHDVHAFCYIWHHPNLGVVSGGAWAWQGIKPGSLSCELFDMLIYVDDAVLDGDLHDVQLPNGYRSTVIEPLKRLRARYADEAHGNAFDIEFEALAPPMVLETGFHFEQPMKTSGSLTLAGTDYVVDGMTVRDRSWGQLRHERHVDLPPMSWMTGLFGDDLSFGTTAFDSEEPDDEFPVLGGDALRGGWICRDGQYSPVVSVSKRTRRNAGTLFPEAVELAITDSGGYSMELRGKIIAASNWRAWHNMNSVICLTRWECDGRIGYGDFQDVQFQPYVQRFVRKRSAGRAAAA